MIVKDILASLYVILDNATEQELEPAVALENLGSVLAMMKFEQIFGNLDDVIRKESVVFSDTTGIVENTLTDFGDVVYLQINNTLVDECPVSQLENYRNASMQRVAFWTDAEDDTSYIQLSIPETGTLNVWYEPYETIARTRESNIEFHQLLRWCIVYRLAKMCLPMVKYRNVFKMQNKPILSMEISNTANEWKQVYLEKVNRIGTGKPFTRIPYMAGV